MIIIKTSVHTVCTGLRLPAPPLSVPMNWSTSSFMFEEMCVDEMIDMTLTPVCKYKATQVNLAWHNHSKQGQIAGLALSK